MSPKYFSDREGQSRARTIEEIGEPAWGGIAVLVRSLVSSGAFGVDFPIDCPDGRGPYATDEQRMGLALRAEVPDLDFPPDTATVPPTNSVLDFIEFCYRHVAEPSKDDYHSFFGHYHLSFDRSAGQAGFRDRITTIFERNGLLYELTESGEIHRLAPPILREALASQAFDTGDPQLNSLLESARQKFLSPKIETRREALEKLWDAWERVKTVIDSTNKKKSAGALLDRAAKEPNMRKMLEAEATELTRIGNEFQIRHFETSKVPVQESNHVDYLFHRLFGMIQLLIRALK